MLFNQMVGKPLREEIVFVKIAVSCVVQRGILENWAGRNQQRELSFSAN